MKLDVGKVVDKMTRENYIPTNSMKSGNDYFSLVHNIAAGEYIDLVITNSTYLVG